MIAPYLRYPRGSYVLLKEITCQLVMYPCWCCGTSCLATVQIGMYFNKKVLSKSPSGTIG
jgi:hypothetical protein